MFFIKPTCHNNLVDITGKFDTKIIGSEVNDDRPNWLKTIKKTASNTFGNNKINLSKNRRANYLT